MAWVRQNGESSLINFVIRNQELVLQDGPASFRSPGPEDRSRPLVLKILEVLNAPTIGQRLALP